LKTLNAILMDGKTFVSIHPYISSNRYEKQPPGALTLMGIVVYDHGMVIGFGFVIPRDPSDLLGDLRWFWHLSHPEPGACMQPSRGWWSLYPRRGSSHLILVGEIQVSLSRILLVVRGRLQMINLEIVRIRIMLRQIKGTDSVSILAIDNGFIPFQGNLGHGIYGERDQEGSLRSTVQEG
jgi:hypothetical protein